MKKHIFLFVITGAVFSAFTFFISELPIGQSNLFSGSGNCVLCHSATTGVLTNAVGRDVSPLYHWQSSMMGNSAKDPYWQAKVSSEVEENPHLQEIIEDKCATCHAPMGRTEAIYNGQNYYSFSEILQDPLSLDGVSCTACHQIDADNLATEESFSGKYMIKPLKNIYGPYQNPFTTSMVNNTGYTPVFGQHIQSSALCATCHTLSTPYVDSEGNVAGYFPEQMPYYEWLNSSYPGQDISCQKCHMPNVNENMKISSMPANLQNIRNPVFEHHFVGGNTVVNRMMKENYTELGINSGVPNLDTTYHYAQNNLLANSLELSTDLDYDNNVVSVNVNLLNKTGHKLPTGFPSRRMWIHFTASDADGDTIFESGKYDNKGIISSQEDFETHHDTISNGNHVQIYETILGNTEDEPTTILLEASQYLKDNRIPPAGFKNGQPYDSLIAITGHAAEDPNFNKYTDGLQGSGSDRVTYSFPFSGGTLNYAVEICYQSISPAFSEHISESETNESNRFTRMFENNSLSKLQIIASLNEQVSLTNIKENKTQEWNIFPNPTKGEVFIGGIENRPAQYFVYSLTGELVANQEIETKSISLHHLPKGSYILKIKSDRVEKSFSVVLN